MSDLEKSSTGYYKGLREIAQLKNEITQKYQTNDKLREKVKIYETGQGIENLSDEELCRLESQMLFQLETVKNLKIKKKFDEKILFLSKTLEKQLSTQKINEILYNSNTKQ